MRILALVPARGGSKRLPGKNIRALGDKPLIVWSIDVAKTVPGICDVLVSTDDSTIAEVCRQAGALVPWLRPAELATDTAGSVDVALHALDWYEREYGAVDGLLLLQPTSPFRTTQTVTAGIAAFAAAGGCAVVGVSPCSEHPLWTFKEEDGHLVPYLGAEGIGKRSQDLPPAFVVNGSFYLCSPTALRATRSFIGEASVPLIINAPHEAIDIDTAWDWTLAESVLRCIETDN